MKDLFCLPEHMIIISLPIAISIYLYVT